MYDEKRDLIVSYRAMPVILDALLQEVRDQAATSRGVDTEWSTGEVVCHLLDAEQRDYERVLRIRDEERPALPIYPDDEYWGRPLPRTVDALIRLRHEHARVLEALSPAAWARTGLHEIQGEITIIDITRHAAAHDAEHLAQIAGQRDVTASGAPGAAVEARDAPGPPEGGTI
jgi:hypothetical protein